MTLADAIINRDIAAAAYREALVARTVSYADKQVSRQDVAALRQEFQFWERICTDLQRLSIPTAPACAIARWTR